MAGARFSSLTCLAPELDGLEGLAQLELFLESPHGLSTQLGLPHSMEASGWLDSFVTDKDSGSECSRKQAGNLQPSMTQPQKSCGLMSAILHRSKPSQALPDPKGGDTDPTLSVGGVPNSLQLWFGTATPAMQVSYSPGNLELGWRCICLIPVGLGICSR